MSVEAFERALYDELRLDPELVTHVGDPPRIYTGRVPQLGSQPAIRIRRLSSEPQYTLQNELPVAMAAYEIVAQVKGGSGSTVVKQMADAIRDLLSGRCSLIGEAPNQVDVQGCLIAGDSSFYQPPQDATDEGTFSHIFDMRFTYNQSVPAHA